MKPTSSKSSSGKGSTRKETLRLFGNPLPISPYLRGSKVQIYLGHGWATGVVISSNDSRCNVLLIKEQRIVCCTDNRNIMNAKDDKQN